MAHAEVSQIIPAPSAVVFDLLHDYSRRLAWDTLLQAAYLTDGFTAACVGATSVCKGRWSLGGIALKTVYVTFDRPTLAAVKMVNHPPLFDTWAASIRHEDWDGESSRITYKFHFIAKPAFLSPLFDSIMGRVFRWETRKRLAALRDYLSDRRNW